MNSYDLKGRKAVVTGGAQGIGRAIVERFLDSGAIVTIWDADRALGERTAAELEGRGTVYVNDPDVSDWGRVQSATARTVAEMGGVDILVANAGIAGANATVIDTDPAEWSKVIDIDLNGVFHCCKAVAPHMVEAGYGRIVNTASIAGKEGNPNAAHYSSAKAGVIALTKSLGKELAQHDIAVNCITPAAAKTAIFDQVEQY
ncbi:MAG: SDR family NAD(P)-dependent oxidoreductase, partial [Pseudomonadota bacterium]